MTSCRWTLTMALSVAGAIALSTPSEARGGRNAAIGFGVAAGALALGAAAGAALQPHYHYHDGYYGGPYAYSYGHAPAYGVVYDSYNYNGYSPYYGAPGWRGLPAPRYGAD